MSDQGEFSWPAGGERVEVEWRWFEPGRSGHCPMCLRALMLSLEPVFVCKECGCRLEQVPGDLRRESTSSFATEWYGYRVVERGSGRPIVNWSFSADVIAQLPYAPSLEERRTFVENLRDWTGGHLTADGKVLKIDLGEGATLLVKME